ncbi:MAG: PD40 domain-containing protein [Chloroflexi bacterium]|nr:PD40 domain-containing protein [Chloroflexota bacterium]OJV89769.1 MAG: hypothetical protein BGO39_28920 [Chloroflexi bacterium 54-19]
MKRPHSLSFQFTALLSLTMLLVGLILVACSDTPTTPPTTPISSGNPSTASGNGSSSASGTKVAAPVTGPDGQITVMAPPPTGENISGQIFWVKENNIWQSGAGTPGVPPITTKDLGGKQLTKATPLAIAQSPAISPDGAKMAYAFSPEPEGTQGNIVIGQDIHVLDLKTGEDKLLINRDEPQGFLDHPAWSKDGKYLYFSSRVPRRDSEKNIVGEAITINRLELATGTREKLADDAREPVPLPDGKSVIYTHVMASTGTYETSLQIMNLQTKEVKTLLTKELGFIGIYFPQPSPDGQWISFAAAGGPDINPYASPTATPSGQASNNAALGNPLGFNLGMTGLLPFGANPKSLNAPAAHGVPYDVWLVKPDGTGLKRLTSLFEDQPMTAWSNDGKKIAFLAGQGFYSINSDGTNLVKISDRGAHSGFDWVN